MNANADFKRAPSWGSESSVTISAALGGLGKVPLQTTVLRPRLSLPAEVGGKCHLIFAPPGYGKSVLLRQWIEDLAHRGWRTLQLRADAAPDCLERWLFEIGGLEPAFAPAGSSVGVAAAHNILRALDRTGAAAGHIALAVEDLDAATDPRVSDVVYHLAANLRDQQALLVASARKPLWPLETLQLDGALRIVGRDSLALDVSETEAIVRLERPGVRDSFSIERLHAAVDGWPAVTRLALQDGFELRSDTSDPLNCQRVVGYLEEIVARVFAWEGGVFISQCAVLGPICTELCRDVLGDEAARRFAGGLDLTGLFEPVRLKAHWFALNPVLAEHLHRKMLSADAAAVANLHSRASAWHLAAGQPAEALRHAVAATDFATALNILKDHVRSLVRGGRLQVVFQLVDRIPKPLLAENIRIVLPLLWGALVSRRLDRAAELADTIEHSLERPDEGLSLDERPYSTAILKGVIAAARCTLKHYADPAWGDTAFVRKARETHSSAHPLIDAKFLELTSEMYVSQDNLEAAYVASKESEYQYSLDENLFGRAEAMAAMVRIRLLQGHLQEAHELCEQTLVEAVDREGPLPAASDVRLALAEIQYEQNNIPGTERELSRAWALVHERDAPYLHIRALAIESDVRRARGADWSGAAAPLLHAEELANDRRISGLRAHVKDLQALCAVHYGELEVAQALLSQNGYVATARQASHRILPAEETGYFALALLCNRLQDPHLAMRLTKRLLQGAENAKRWRAAATYRTYLAVLHVKLDQEPEALRMLRDVVVLAQAHGFVRSVIDVGPEVRRLLRTFVEVREGQPRSEESDVQIAYARRLAGANLVVPILGRATRGSAASAPDEVDLTERELQIITLLARGLRNREIAGELLVGETTVKWHVRNLLEKSGCRSRTEVAAWARDLRLLD